MAEAPSESCDALPAVTVPPSSAFRLEDRLQRADSPSRVVEARLHSSSSTVNSSS